MPVASARRHVHTVRSCARVEETPISIRPSRLAAAVLFLAAAGCRLQTPAGPDPEGPRLRIPPTHVNEKWIDLVGTAGPNRELDLLVNGERLATTTADAQGEFRFEDVLLVPGMNRIRVELVPRRGEIPVRTRGEGGYEPPPYAEVKVVLRNIPF